MACTVLIVDDHAGFRRSVHRLLEAAGYDIVGEVSDGSDALAATALLRPDVVLLDVVLPGQDGFAVADELAGLRPGPTVVLISSRRESDFGERLRRTRAAAFIHKGDLSVERLAAVPGVAHD